MPVATSCHLCSNGLISQKRRGNHTRIPRITVDFVAITEAGILLISPEVSRATTTSSSPRLASKYSRIPRQRIIQHRLAIVHEDTKRYLLKTQASSAYIPVLQAPSAQFIGVSHIRLAAAFAARLSIFWPVLPAHVDTFIRHPTIFFFFRLVLRKPLSYFLFYQLSVQRYLRASRTSIKSSNIYRRFPRGPVISSPVKYLDSRGKLRSSSSRSRQTKTNNSFPPPMPYNTRRKSLSLPSLGIQLPHGSRAHPQTPPSSAKGDHPSKKTKRAHSPLSTVQNAEPTPPLSPPPERVIDYEDLSDEIVAGVVRILEGTGNRPHTVKELAVVLAPTINIVEQYVTPPLGLVRRYPTPLSYAYLTPPQLRKSPRNNILPSERLPQARVHARLPLRP